MARPDEKNEVLRVPGLAEASGTGERGIPLLSRLPRRFWSEYPIAGYDNLAKESAGIMINNELRCRMLH